MISRHAMVFLVNLVSALAVSVARPASAQPAHDPCALLTPQQVSAAAGSTVGAGQSIGTAGCQWSTPDDPSARSVKVMVTLSLLDERAFPRSAPSPGFVLTTVRGVGDDAVFTTVGPFTSFAVKKGGSTFVVRVYGVRDPARQQAIEKSLASDVLARW
jgi:hypothetical protein